MTTPGGINNNEFMWLTDGACAHRFAELSDAEIRRVASHAVEAGYAGRDRNNQPVSADDFARQLLIRREEKKRELRPLCVAELVENPMRAYCESDWDRRDWTTCIDTVLPTAWERLQAETAELLDKWKFITTTRRSGLLGPEDPEARERRTVELGRFQNVELVRATAIADPVRSARNGRPQYLHANEVRFDSGPEFIASQKPVAGEIPGLWRVILERKVPLIVDLSNARDNRHEPRYRPRGMGEAGKAEYGEVTVRCESRTKDTTLPAAGKWPSKAYPRLERLSVQAGADAHTVKRLHVPAWPDHGVIDDRTLIAIADRVESLAGKTSGPVWVHCKAGVGRTGTLISFMAARKMIEREMKERAMNEGRCDFEMILRNALQAIAQGRLERGPAFVQNREQFLLLVGALHRHFLGQGLQLSASVPPEEVRDFKSGPSYNDRMIYALKVLGETRSPAAAERNPKGIYIKRLDDAQIKGMAARVGLETTGAQSGVVDPGAAKQRPAAIKTRFNKFLDKLKHPLRRMQQQLRPAGARSGQAHEAGQRQQDGAQPLAATVAPPAPASGSVRFGEQVMVQEFSEEGMGDLRQAPLKDVPGARPRRRSDRFSPEHRAAVPEGAQVYTALQASTGPLSEPKHDRPAPAFELSADEVRAILDADPDIRALAPAARQRILNRHTSAAFLSAVTRRDPGPEPELEPYYRAWRNYYQLRRTRAATPAAPAS